MHMETKIDLTVIVAAIVALLIGVLTSVISSVLEKQERIQKRTKNIIVVLSVLLAIATLSNSFISTWQASQQRAPSFRGEIGNFDKSKAFFEFITSNDGKHIYIDIYMDYLTVQVSYAVEAPSFILWVNCPLWQSGIALSTDVCSEGHQYNFSEPLGNNYIFEPYRNVHRVKGYFYVEDISGPYLGIMVTTLRPVLPEDVP